MSQSAWDVLGIEPTSDVRAIKRAYAKALKTTRPDSDPTAFQWLTEAFEWAQAQARAQADMKDRETGSGADPDSTRLADTRNPDDGLAETVPALGRPIEQPRPADSAGMDNEAPDATEQSFEFAPFFAEMSAQLRDSNPGILQRWLQQHPALYSIELKWALLPYVFDAIASNASELDPHRGHLEVLQTFFGIDASLRRHPALAPALDYLESRAWHHPQRQPDPALPQGWENIGQVMSQSENGDRRRQHEASSGGLRWLGWVVWMLLLSSIARGCMGLSQ